MSQAPGRELLNQNVEALDVPNDPKPTLPSAKEADARAPIPYTTPIQGQTHPVLNPDDTLPIAYPEGF